MQQETADEFMGFNGHFSGFILFSVPVGKDNSSIVNGNDAVV